jgi:tRNA dimethylallyltransferase
MSRSGTLVVIGGPTASGKTLVAAHLAKHYATEVISADSRQFYGALRIGTARPHADELLGVTHHFLGHLPVEETWSAGAFARAAEPALQRIIRERGIAVLVGGSGLYIDALLKGLDPMPGPDPRLRAELRAELEADGLAPLLARLLAADPDTYSRIDRHNPHRVLRALEIVLSTGRPVGEQHTAPADRTDMRIIRVLLDLPRAALYARIDTRVERMMADGLLEEVRRSLPYRSYNALRTVGYTELFDHLDGKLTLDEAVALIKQHTRNYAKRQLTWSRREPSWVPLPPVPEQVILHVESTH